ncbi:hypothetical protein ASE69_06370 [Sphingomonas sp. Leaf208]|nr:hypothetical protein ASE69_06370 [Sphingomonas sp. Leaf208]
MRSAAVSRPDAIAAMQSSIAVSAEANPWSSTCPASKSIQPGLRWANSVFDAIWIVGTGKPSGCRGRLRGTA